MVVLVDHFAVMINTDLQEKWCHLLAQLKKGKGESSAANSLQKGAASAAGAGNGNRQSFGNQSVMTNLCVRSPSLICSAVVKF